MKLLLLCILLICFSCEGIISSKDIENNTTNQQSFNVLPELVTSLNLQTGDALNELMYISAISTDEAIETSSVSAHNLLGQQNFGQFNSNVLRVYQKFQALAKDAHTAQQTIHTLDTTIIKRNFNSSVLVNFQQADTLYRAYAMFYEAYACYKLASNWKNAQLLHQTTNYVDSTLFTYTDAVLDSGISMLETLQTSIAKSETTPGEILHEGNEIQRLLALMSYYSAYTNINRSKMASTSALKQSLLQEAYNSYSAHKLTVQDYNVTVKNSIVYTFSNATSARLVFNPSFLLDDERIAIYKPTDLRLQGSATIDSIHGEFNNNIQASSYLQNRFSSSTIEVPIFHEKDNESLLRAEIMYRILEDRLTISSSLDAATTQNIQKLIHNALGFSKKRTKSTEEVSTARFTFSTKDNEDIRKVEVKQFLLLAYLSVDFLEGTRFETLRRLGEKPYRSSTSTEYAFPATY